MTIGALTALAVPLGFGYDAYRDETEMRLFQARLAADRVAQYAYVQGHTWRFSEHRIAELIAFVVLPNDAASVEVDDTRGNLIAAIGEPQGRFVVRCEAPIVAGAEVVGAVTVEASLLPFFVTLSALAAIGFALGAAIYACVYYLPLRTLRSTLASLAEAQAEVSAQVARTEAALQIAQSERQRAERASRTKSEFLANMSHELRTPLNAIIGFSELMKMQAFGALEERYLSYSKDINDSGAHLLGIINDLLDIAKIEAGRLVLDFEPANLDDLLDACARLLKPQADGAKITLLVPGRSDGPHSMLGDYGKLRQILLNLMANAVKFTPEGGTVTVTARDGPAGWVEIVVADTGIGMSAEEIALALQPFRQVDNSHTRKYQGTGLGLTLARVLTELHHGMLDVASEPGQGTTVTVRLPTGTPLYGNAEAAA